LAKVRPEPYRGGVPKEFEELEGLHVEVDDVMYMPSLDAPSDRPHPFVYFINIRNDSKERVSILGRKWLVREDGYPELVVVEGDGVVGQFPEIAPGGVFSYNSYHVTRGPGTAEGSFFGETESGRRIFTRIPTFKLTLPAES
jgi:ApaG protein